MPEYPERPERISSSRIGGIGGLGEFAERPSCFYVYGKETGDKSGWVDEGDTPTSHRLFAAACAIWALNQANAGFQAKIFYERHCEDPVNKWFEGVYRIELE